METTERLEMLQEAMDLITEAQQLVDEAVSETNIESHYKAYGKYGFDQLLGNGNPYDNGLPTLINNIEDEMDNDDDVDPAGGYGLASHI